MTTARATSSNDISISHPSAGTSLNRPRVSIGIPTYNAERYLATAIECFLNQTVQDLEIVISDNASTDGTVDIVHDYMRRDPRIRLSQVPKNQGASRNFNRLVYLARAPYFRWASADDLSAPTAVERCLEILEQDRSVVLAYPKTTLIGPTGEKIGDYDDNLHLVEESPSERLQRYLAQVALCNAVYGLMRTDQLRRTPLLGAFRRSDVILQAELALMGKIWEVPERLFYRRFHESASSAMDMDQLTVRYDPAKKKRFYFPSTRQFYEYVRSAIRVPLGVRERVRVMGVLGKNVVQARRAYRDEWSAYFENRPV